jgi:Transposase IS66 family
MLEEFLSEVRGLLCSSPVVRADEAGLRVEDLLAWVHAVSTTGLTLYHLDRRRGTAAMDGRHGCPPAPVRCGRPRRMDPYRHCGNVAHSLGNAHPWELEAAAESDGQQRATDMAALLAGTWHRARGEG